MVWDDITMILRAQKFKNLSGNIPNIGTFYKTEEGKMNICCLIRNFGNIHFTGEQLQDLSFQLERKFLLQGMHTVNIMYFIFSNNTERDKTINQYPVNFWIFDMISGILISYENQPYDYFGMRDSFEHTLLQQNKKKKINFDKVPICTYILILINVFVFIILNNKGDSENNIFLINHGAIYWPLVYENGEYWRLFTSIFMHIGFSHLFNNMLSLALIGPQIEYSLGKIKYLILYNVSGIGAGLLSSLYYMSNSEKVVAAGASGAIFGLLGCIVGMSIFEKRYRNRILFSRFILILIWVLYNGFSSTDIDNIAHLGGLLFGMIIMLIYHLINKNRLMKYSS